MPWHGFPAQPVAMFLDLFVGATGTIGPLHLPSIRSFAAFPHRFAQCRSAA
jgi:hypothetical protein